MTRQVLQSYLQIRQALPSAKEDFVRDYSAIKEDLSKAEKNISDLSPLFGVGSPEGVVVANLSKTYIDTTNSPANVTMWVNETVGADTGWLMVV